MTGRIVNTTFSMRLLHIARAALREPLYFKVLPRAGVGSLSLTFTSWVCSGYMGIRLETIIGEVK